MDVLIIIGASFLALWLVLGLVLGVVLLIFGIAVGFVATAVRLFDWAAEYGFIGIALYVIVWAVATPLMVIVCLVGASTFYRDDADNITEYRSSSSLPFESANFESINNDDAEPLALIDELLARSDISEETRKELEDYKIDIASGAWTASDDRYIRAFYARLTKNV